MTTSSDKSIADYNTTVALDSFFVSGFSCDQIITEFFLILLRL